MSMAQSLLRPFRERPTRAEREEHAGWMVRELHDLQDEMRAEQRKQYARSILALSPEQLEKIIGTVLVRYPSIYRKPVEAAIAETLIALHGNVIATE